MTAGGTSHESSDGKQIVVECSGDVEVGSDRSLDCLRNIGTNGYSFIPNVFHSVADGYQFTELCDGQCTIVWLVPLAAALSCRTCYGTSFGGDSRKSQLVKHLKTVHYYQLSEQFICRFCGHSEENLRTCNLHVKRSCQKHISSWDDHSVALLKSACEVCGKRFGPKGISMRTHMRMHEENERNRSSGVEESKIQLRNQSQKCRATATKPLKPQTEAADVHSFKQKLPVDESTVVELDDFPVLSPPEQRALCTVHGISLYANDIRCLSPCTWFTDSIIDCYLTSMCKSAQERGIGAMNLGCFFQTKVASDPIDARHLLSDPVLFEQQFLLIPLFTNGDHWQLFILCLSTESPSYVFYCPGSYIPDWDRLDVIASVFIDAAREHNVIWSDFNCWAGNVPQEPHQPNNYDCGPYILLFAEQLINGQSNPAFGVGQAAQLRTQFLATLETAVDATRPHPESLLPLGRSETLLTPVLQSTEPILIPSVQQNHDYAQSDSSPFQKRYLERLLAPSLSWEGFEMLCREFATEATALALETRKSKFKKLITGKPTSKIPSVPNITTEINSQNNKTLPKSVVFNKSRRTKVVKSPGKRGSATPRFNPRLARKLQLMYRSNRKRALRYVLNQQSPACFLDPGEAFEYYHERLASAIPIDWNSHLVPPFIKNLRPVETDPSLESPFDANEVWRRLKRMKDSAPGHDGLSYRAIKQVDPGCLVLVEILNRCRRESCVPDEWKRCHSILIYKKGEIDDFSNWRQISIQLCLYKMYTALLSDRISQWAIKGNIISREQQKGFDHLEGCAEHAYSLQSIIDDARRHRCEVAIAWLDLRDAFPSLSHDLIFGILGRCGMPSGFMCILRDLYHNASVSVRVKNGESQPVPIRRGIKQGDPLSPVLFNICMEVLLRTALEELEDCGYELFDKKVITLAYADDMVVICRSPTKLQFVLDRLVVAAEWARLEFQPFKCGSLHMKDARATGHTFTLIDSEIPRLKEGAFYQYLGTPEGLRNQQSHYNLLTELLRHSEILFRSCLAPWQKLDAFRFLLYPRLVFTLRHYHWQNVKVLRDFDNTVRQMIKRYVLNLPREASAHYIYGDQNSGCVGLPSAEEDHLVSRISHGLRLLYSPSQLVSHTAWSELWSTVSKALSIRQCDLTMDDVVAFLNSQSDLGPAASSGHTLWMDVRKRLRTLNKSFKVTVRNSAGELTLEIHPPCGAHPVLIGVQGKRMLVPTLHKALRLFHTVQLSRYPSQGKVADCLSVSHPASNKFMYSGKYIRFKDYRFIHSARLNLLETRNNAVKGSRSCRICGYYQETLPHVLNHCMKKHAASYQQRHNGILERLVRALPKETLTDGRSRYEVKVNRIASHANSRKRPDLQVFDRINNTASIVDVAIAFENRQQAFWEARASKWAKYDEIVNSLRKDGYAVYIDAFIVGSLGTWDVTNDTVLRKLGVSKRYSRLMRHLCCAEVLQLSTNIYRQHVGLDGPASQ